MKALWSGWKQRRYADGSVEIAEILSQTIHTRAHTHTLSHTHTHTLTHTHTHTYTHTHTHTHTHTLSRTHTHTHTWNTLAAFDIHSQIVFTEEFPQESHKHGSDYYYCHFKTSHSHLIWTNCASLERLKALASIFNHSFDKTVAETLLENNKSVCVIFQIEYPHVFIFSHVICITIASLNSVNKVSKTCMHWAILIYLHIYFIFLQKGLEGMIRG